MVLTHQIKTWINYGEHLPSFDDTESEGSSINDEEENDNVDNLLRDIFYS